MTHVCPMKGNVKGKALWWHSSLDSDLIHIKILHALGWWSPAVGSVVLPSTESLAEMQRCGLTPFLLNQKIQAL